MGKRGAGRKKRVSGKSHLYLSIFIVLALVGAGAAYFAARAAGAGLARSSALADYKRKAGLIRQEALSEESRAAAGESPAGGQAGHAVFISLCNTQERAAVFTGTGADLEAAWDSADKKAREFLKGSNYKPVWVKADVVCGSEVVDMEELSERVLAARSEFFRYGIAFDKNFGTALLEAELNGAKIYDYDNGGVDLEYLNRYLAKAGRGKLEGLPDACTLFRCQGWFCGEEGEVHRLCPQGLEYGRRRAELIDREYAGELLASASDFLVRQVREDGSFVYGMYPRFDNEIDNYNMVRHASTIWSLVCYYRLTGDEGLGEVIERTIGYMLGSVVYRDPETAYLYEEKDDEIKLGGCGVAVVALTEYMDAFGNEKYAKECRALGNGILTMLDGESGEYYHVLNGDFTRKEEYRTVYYDGEATFALCRLYGLTGEGRWLEAAEAAVGHFIKEDYAKYKDHWVAYSMNELTKYTDNAEYYAFALRNAQENLDAIYSRDTTYHTYSELLLSTFEVYDRMVERGIEVEYAEEEFDLEYFLKTIYARMDRMLNGYFYPEYAMYMANPKRILGTFMVRHDGYRVRIDDVQHNIDGYYQYYKNYDKLVGYGMLECRD